jgi:hypothetical protein
MPLKRKQYVWSGRLQDEGHSTGKAVVSQSC